MWQDAFHEAYHEVQLEIFKAKIKATMSKSMEKTAALVLEAMTDEAEKRLLASFNRELAAIDPRQARVVEMRYYGGMTVEETAEALAIAPRTVKREWAMAKAWLRVEISSGLGR